MTNRSGGARSHTGKGRRQRAHSAPEDVVWAKTGIDVSPAQSLLITATGFWVVNLDESWGFRRGASGPDGLGSGWSGDQFTNFGGTFVDDVGALIGFIGATPPP